jgi:hypothetical protein
VSEHTEIAEIAGFEGKIDSRNEESALAQQLLP